MEPVAARSHESSSPPAAECGGRAEAADGGRPSPAVSPESPKKLSAEARQFYRQAYKPARAGCLNLLRGMGCSEEEAEEIFQATFTKVMERVDPVERGFAIPQMVKHLKVSCQRTLIDQRRHRGVLRWAPLSDASFVPDEESETPIERAETHEAVAIGKEAVASLPQRDRDIFLKRHHLDLEPEEILAGLPGLSQRTYRKIMQRANARVLQAFEEIDTGDRCEEMERSHLHRFLTSEASPDEVRVVHAHLRHCRSCQMTFVQMREYLHDVASSLGIAAGAAEATGHGGLIPAVADHLVRAGDSMIEATRGLRERVRDIGLRIATSVPGSGGDATAGQVLGASTAKLAGTCVGGALAAGAACVALGVSPIAVVGIQNGKPTAPHRIEPKARKATTTSAPVINPVRHVPPEAEAASEEAAPPSHESTRSSNSSAPTKKDAPDKKQEPIRRFSESSGKTDEEDIGLGSTGTPVGSSSPSTAESGGGEETAGATPSVSSGSSTGSSASSPEQSASPAPQESGGSKPAPGGPQLGL